ncbi:Uncharacterised protein [Mycobacteroides abscessus subsp. abscessus]|nr:Uncharacterised protein [Mycobacteroides abscessus subsp. abscessus]
MRSAAAATVPVNEPAGPGVAPVLARIASTAPSLSWFGRKSGAPASTTVIPAALHDSAILATVCARRSSGLR